MVAAWVPHLASVRVIQLHDIMPNGLGRNGGGDSKVSHWAPRHRALTTIYPQELAGSTLPTIS